MLVLPTSAFAEAEATVNGADIDSTVVDFYLESALQKPAADATAEERGAVIRELTDIYLLTTQPEARQLAASERFKAQIELQKRGALAQAVAQDFVAQNQASDEEILAAYEQQIAATPPLQYKARHILVENQAAAIDLISQLDSGSDFQELAKEHSTGPSGPSGGDLPWFSPEQMVQPFSEAVAALEDGKYSSEPVQTQFGWHVILREDSRANEPPTLDSVRATIKQNVEQAKFQAYLEKLRSDFEASE
jgi:peptidyl-prolyl cis-trans isomerase C